jgi:hypothetical protein
VGRREDDIGRDEAPSVGGDLRSLAGQADRYRRDPDRDPPADERRRDRVVGAQDPDEGILAGSGLEMEVGVGQWIRESAEELALDRGGTSDLAAWSDWLRCIEQVKGIDPSARRSFRPAPSSRP